MKKLLSLILALLMIFACTSVAFAAMSGAFIGGQGDFVTLFEPSALELEKNGYLRVQKNIRKSRKNEIPHFITLEYKNSKIFILICM